MSNSQKESAESNPSDVQIALETFAKESDEMVDALLLEMVQCQLPPLHYHYTTDVGLRGILESGRLWLTDIFSLNDPSELQHGISLATDVLEKKVSGQSGAIQKFARDFRTLSDKGTRRVFRCFVCSFSQAGDDLGQWRAYADNGRGYALGFETGLPKSAFNVGERASDGTQISGGEMFPVTYNDCKLRNVYGEMTDKLLPIIKLLSQAEFPETVEREDNWKRLLVHFSIPVALASLYFKHMAYDNEKEYRFLEMHRTDVPAVVSLRPRNYKLIEYREFDWRSTGGKILQKIVIGPAADFKQSKQFAEDCLRLGGMDAASVEITQSQIPYKPA